MATDGRTPDERTDAHQKFEASCTKALRAISKLLVTIFDARDAEAQDPAQLCKI